jgi:hypothetical protein
VQTNNLFVKFLSCVVSGSFFSIFLNFHPLLRRIQ